MSNTFKVSTSGGQLLELNWAITPADWAISEENQLQITAGATTDLFNDPATPGKSSNSAPVAFFTPPHSAFLLSAKVKVEFGATYDAGTLQVYFDENLWGKLCFEYSPQCIPMVVSVVTRGESDDCNSVAIEGHEVYLRVAYNENTQTCAFHYSLDGSYWHLVRYFGWGNAFKSGNQPKAGFSSQSPTGPGCTVFFSQINYSATTLADIRNGE